MTISDHSVQNDVAVLAKSSLKNIRTHRIQPTKGWTSLKVKEVWDYRELITIFVWRDLKVRYRQTVIGVLWAILQPFLTMVIFSIFFGRLAGIPSDGIPYPVFSFAALVPWTFFANSISLSANSLIGNPEMIKKIYFPRLTMPIASILAGFVDFVLAFIILLGMMLFYGYFPTINTLWLPFFILLAVMTAVGVGLWLGAMNVKYRDVRYMVPFIIQAWLFATPVAYPSSLLTGPWRTLYGLNPMASVVEGFRWALLGTAAVPGSMVAVSFVVSCLLLISGIFYFRRMEKTFADVI